MIKTILVVGSTAAQREEKIANTLAACPDLKSAVLIEGLPDGKSALQSLEKTVVVRIAPGCICCSNNMIMRVHLNRLIQQKPDQLLISLSNNTHLQAIKTFLVAPDYKKVLELSIDIQLN